MSKAPESLENYLAQIARELRDLPPQARADELREIEAHLQTMIEARQDVAGVLAQFGKPRRVGRDLRRAWERRQPEAWWRVIAAPIVGFALQTILSLLLTILVVLGSYFSSFTQMENVFSASVAENFYIFFFFLSYVALAITTGFGVGAVSPKRGKGVITFFALATLAMLSSELFKGGFADFDNPMAPLLTSFGFIGGAFLVLCLLLLFGNRLGARYTRRRLYRVAPTQ